MQFRCVKHCNLLLSFSSYWCLLVANESCKCGVVKAVTTACLF